MTVRVLVGDCREMLRTLPDASVQCVVTSPPYYGLRDYGTASWEGGDPECDHGVKVSGGPKQTKGEPAQNGHASAADRLNRDDCGKCGARRIDQQIGLEQTPDEYVAEMVGVFREVRRVLRDDGVLLLNIGDSYANDSKWGGSSGGKHVAALHGDTGVGRGKKHTGLKGKDLIGIPWMLAFALRADGWFLRADIIWHKPNPMPESVTDRPTKSHEYVFLLTKRASYFYDAEAVKEAATKPPQRMQPSDEAVAAKSAGPMARGGGVNHQFRDTDRLWAADGTRNLRSVWTINPQPYSGAHFATMPPMLAERCILAGTSEMGCCPACGAPWKRTITKGEPDNDHKAACGADSAGGYNGLSTKGYKAAGVQDASDLKRRILDGMRKKTYGWKPTCNCPPSDPVPCTVLDPFSGAGTTALVADRLGRHAIGIELNPEYADMARRRIAKDSPLFADVS